MAKMIPDVVDSYNGSYGELSVYNALKNLPDDYVVFHSVNWNKKNNKKTVEWGESDFTIFNPKRGLLVIEVKSGGIKHYEGNWYQTNTKTNEVTKMKDPMVQASRSKYTFIDILSEANYLTRNYWIESAVWFPSVECISIIGDLPPSYNNANTFTKENLSNPQKAIENAYNYYNIRENVFYHQEDIDGIVKIFSPFFNAIPSMAQKIEEQEYYFNRMTNEQSSLLDYLQEQRVAAIQGGAGTGKTVLAIEKARRFEGKEKVLFLCFNKYLLQYLKDTYGKDIPNVDFHNLYSFTQSRLGNKFSGDDEEITDVLNSYDKYDWDYKHIIIDEGQDIAEEHIELLLNIANLEEGSFYVFYDRNQLVHKHQAFDWLNSIDCRLILSLNCRNTMSIASTSSKSIGIEKVKMKENIVGHKPVFHICNSIESTLEAITKTIRNFTDNGIKKSQIVILTNATLDKSILSGRSTVGSYSITMKRDGKGIFFTTSRKFKGLEADAIIMIDINDKTFGIEQNRRVFYVGSSRAKHFLEIFATLDLNGLKNLGIALEGEGCKNPRLAISSYLKVKITNE